jgi:hypothetical protein
MMLFLFGITYAQVGINTTTPHVSSMLDVTSTTKGLLTPRMTFAQRNLIGTPATGLLIFQTDNTPGFYYYNGAAWTPFGGSTGWGITGNTGTTPASNFLGTTDAQDLVIKANNTEAIRVQSGGNIGVGTNAPSTKLHIQGSNPATSLSDGFEDNTIPPFATAGTGGNWTTTAVAGEFNSGTKGGKSGGGVNSGVSDLTYTTAALTYGGTVSFALRTSSEATYDALIFYIGGVEQARWSGLTAWTTVSYPLPAGVSNLKWTYLKDGSGNSNNDRVYIDDVLVTANGSGAIRIVDGSQSAGKVLTSDASGNASWQTAAPTYTFTNGLTNTSSTIKLGGTLIEDTTIGATSYDLKVASLNNPNMLLVKSNDAVKFGHDGIMWENGNTYTLNGLSTTVKYVTSAMNTASSTRGTTVGIGSVEYFTDGEDEIAASSHFLPIEAGLNLGSAANRWNTLYSTTVVNVSDANLKKNINPLNYGLKELMQLKPVSYNWKDNKIGKTIIPEKLQETRIGFLAQDLLKVIPEVVKTHDWKITEEKSGVYEYKENEVMGVMYNDIIPVIVKALQEQQIMIEKQQKEIDLLKKGMKVN